MFRRDLASGALELVAPGDLRRRADGDVAACAAPRNPSISPPTAATSPSRPAQRLVPADVNGNIDVYVRDMAVRAAGAYELISARDGGDDARDATRRATANAAAQPGRRRQPRRRDRGDGDRVVFRTVDARVRPARRRGADDAAVPAASCATSTRAHAAA